MAMGIEQQNRIARRAAEEIHNGMVVNLGIGLPSLVVNHVPKEISVMFHAENGIVGLGPSPAPGQEDENLCNAGGLPARLNRGGSYCDSVTAFGIIRRGMIDIAVLGSLEVSQTGDLANWIVPGKKVPGMGGALELAQKAKKVIVVMSHCNKEGRPKIVKTCSLPLTAASCVDMIITERAVFKITDGVLWLTEVFAPYELEDIKKRTDGEYLVSKKWRKNPY